MASAQSVAGTCLKFCDVMRGLNLPHVTKFQAFNCNIRGVRVRESLKLVGKLFILLFKFRSNKILENDYF